MRSQDVALHSTLLAAPAGLHCTPRQGMVTSWLVRPGAVTCYEADCD